MARDTNPDDVRRFILTSMSSVPYLEATLLLRNNPSALWDRKMLAQRLYVSEKKAAELLSELQNAGFVITVDSSTPLYQFQPSSTELIKMCDRLADVYSRNIVEVANLIHLNANKQAQQFADAFKWRKD
jgi:Mn-dependent DtxR family transcriptional regulator